MNTRYKFGDLAQNSEKRCYPVLQFTGGRPRARQVVNEPMTVMVITDEPMSNSGLNLAFLYYAARWYSIPQHHNINRKRLASCLAGFILNASDFKNPTPNQSLINAFKTAGIDLIIDNMTGKEFASIANKDLDLKVLTDLIGPEDIRFVIKNTHLPFILGCIILLTMVKNLNDQNFIPWMARRVRSFSGTVGDDWTPTNFSRNAYPDIAQMQSNFIFCSANEEMRREIYIRICSVGVQHGNFIADAFGEIHHLMRGHEMQHLVLIDKYIFEEFPEFLSSILCRGLKDRFSSAMALLNKLPPQNRLYAKLLYNKDDCSLLNRRIFDIPATVATTIAKIRNSTFENYFINDSASHKKISWIVNKFFEIRHSTSMFALEDTGRFPMNTVEREQYHIRAIKDLEAEMEITEAGEDEENTLILPTAALI